MIDAAEINVRKHYLLLIEQDEKSRVLMLEDLKRNDHTVYHQVLKLLETEKSSKILFEKMHSNVEMRILETLSPNEIDRSGENIGSYTLRSIIGTGGMAQVYLAERTDGVFEQTVAIKVMKQELDGSRWLSRFKDERRLLARLNHKNIARIIDGGLLDNQMPYFVMEYVDGIPIDQYCDNTKLTIEERLKIFMKVCQTVQFAHQNLIVHCDLKPGNILITKDGEIKLLDFGISQLLEDFPSHELDGGFAGTPAYASSEQKSGNLVSTATDLYQLGFILYKILLGELPESHVTSHFTGFLSSSKLKEQKRAVELSKKNDSRDFNSHKHFTSLSAVKQNQYAAERNTNPAKLKSLLKGDLCLILRKAIYSKELSVGYSAIAMAEDIKRYLNLQPIHGGKHAWMYSSFLFFRRNKWKSILSAASLLLIISLTTVYLFNLRKSEEKAYLQARKAEVVSGFMIELFKGSDPTSSANGKNLNAYELLQKGMDKAEELSSEPIVQAAMYEAIAKSYSNLNERERARDAIEKAIVIKKKTLSADDPELAGSYEQLGNTLAKIGEYEKAEEVLHRSFAIAKKYNSEAMRKQAVQALSSLAYLYREKRELRKADSVLQLAIENGKNLYSPFDMEMAELYFSMGTIQKALFNYDNSLVMHLKVEEIYDASNIENVVLRQENISGLGVAYIYLQEYDAAEKVLLHAVDILEELDYEDGRMIGAKYDYLSLLYKKKEDYDKAIIYSLRAMKSFMDEYDSNHIYIAVMQFNLGQAYAMMSQVDSSRTYYERSLNGMKKHYTPEDEGYKRVVFIEQQLSKLDSARVGITAL